MTRSDSQPNFPHQARWTIERVARSASAFSSYLGRGRSRLGVLSRGHEHRTPRIDRCHGSSLACHERIAEDHLRILRFFRFHARFGAGAPDAAALAACAARANDLMALSRERIADELVKLLGLANPSPTVALMQQHGIFAPLLPELVDAAGPTIAALAGAELASDIAPDALRRLAAILPRDPLIAAKVAARLKLSNKARKRLALAADPDLDLNPRALAYRHGTFAAVDRLLLAQRPADAATIAHWPIPRLPLTGGDLIARGVVEGPAVARALRDIDSKWVAADFPRGDPFKSLVDEALA